MNMRWPDGTPMPLGTYGLSFTLHSIKTAKIHFAAAQAMIDEARIAIALERYRLAHDGYPGSLDALTPACIDAVPHDIMNERSVPTTMSTYLFVAGEMRAEKRKMARRVLASSDFRGVSLVVAGIGLHQNLSLGQTLSPQMQQSLQFLQAPAMELQSLVQQEIEINPVLEESPDEPEAGDRRRRSGTSSSRNCARRTRNGANIFPRATRRAAAYNPEAAERRQFLFDSQVEAPHLSDHLQRQLTLSTSNPEMLRVGEEIIGNIDDAGFLKVPLVEVAQSARVEYPVAQATLDLIQTFDPVGVAARDLRECLLIQIKRLGKSEELEAQIVGHCLAELGRKKYQDIARTLKVPLERVQAAAQFIATLQPRPGSSFQFRRQAEHRPGGAERAEKRRRLDRGHERRPGAAPAHQRHLQGPAGQQRPRRRACAST